MVTRLAPMFRRATRLAAALLLVVPAQAASLAFPLQNEHLEVDLDYSDGRLMGFLDRHAHWNHVSDQATFLDLWKLEVVSGGKRMTLSPRQVKACRLDPGRDQHSLRLSWWDFGLESAPGLRVVVEVELERTSAMSRWGMTIENQRGLLLEKVQFPQFSAIRPQTNECLAVPVWMGQLMPNPRSLLTGGAGQGARLEWDYPGLTSLQCVAYYRKNGPGLYF